LYFYTNNKNWLTTSQNVRNPICNRFYTHIDLSYNINSVNKIVLIQKIFIYFDHSVNFIPNKLVS